MASEHNKRKKYMEEEQEEEEESTEVNIIYHTCPKYVECACGEIIKGEYAHHICLINLEGKRNLKIFSCTPRCKICMAWMDEQSIKQIFLNQWTEDYENVYVCTECAVICRYGELPKDCECDWYTDKEGEERCKECNLKYNGHCYKCNMAYYKDEKNQKRCSTCDIKIESQYEKPCECDPWYTDDDGNDKCKTCHEKVDGKCEKCIPAKRQKKE